MKILGIESSCDETGVAIVEDGQKILTNVISSSVNLHKKYGGIVPEVAAREQVKVIIPAIQEALNGADLNWENIDAIGVTVGPGLIGSLLVGTEIAKTLSSVLDKPLVPVNHLIGHIYANWLTSGNSKQSAVSKQPQFPLVALIVSGGHTDLIYMKGHGQCKWLGGTRDDAAGEAFDKVARLLGLGYPGGPEIEKIADKGNPKTFNLPRPMIDSTDWDFSFSGLKTAVVNLVHSSKFIVHSKKNVADIAASFQQAIADVLVKKTLAAAKKFGAKTIVVGGGVAANLALRSQLPDYSRKLGINVRFPNIKLCIDNGAMVASAAFYNFKPVPAEKIQAQPGLYF